MRLIDADRLIESVKNHNYCHRCPYSDECYVGDNGQITCENFMIMDIEEQPTAYDVDKVVEEIENKGNYFIDPWVSYMFKKQSKDIVKRGVINE